MSESLLFSPLLYQIKHGSRKEKADSDTLFRSFICPSFTFSAAEQWLEEANRIPASGYYLRDKGGFWRSVVEINQSRRYPQLFRLPQVGDNLLAEKKLLINEILQSKAADKGAALPFLRAYEAEYIYVTLEAIALKDFPDYRLSEEERKRYMPFLEDDCGRPLLEDNSFSFYISWGRHQKLGPLSPAAAGLENVARKISSLKKIVRS